MIEAAPALPKGENLPNPGAGWCKSVHLPRVDTWNPSSPGPASRLGYRCGVARREKPCRGGIMAPWLT
ncbi:hypothetical protein BZL30_7447 [Mycobacterium kansasii]|uniref:Uncharacterized protein n=1 Tax=Mycobacterium kansasii TaxID=1768 RepID=A0A1V3WQ59_MYCKA|nr:hypothetical protein BZL30_7447 [Mycobacterium kansasii]